MKRRGFLGALATAVIALILLGAKPPKLSSPTFTSTIGSIVNNGFQSGDINVSWSEGGLTPGASITYTITGSSSASYICVSGKTSAGPYTVTVDGFSRDPFTLTATSNGTCGNTAGVDEPDAGSLLTDCAGSGGTLLLYQVSYTGIEIVDMTNNVSSPVGSGSFEQTFCSLTKNPQNCPPPS